MKIDLTRLDALVDLMEKNDLSEVELRDGDSLISMELAVQKRRRITDAPQETGVTVTSARVGIFLKRTAVGKVIVAGELIAEIRVMDVKYQVTAPVAGRVEEIFVEDGLGVEYGQPLVRIEPKNE